MRERGLRRGREHGTRCIDVRAKLFRGGLQVRVEAHGEADVGGGRDSAGGVGVGVSVPVGGYQTTTGYAMNSRVTDVGSGKLLWTAKASASPSSDISAQLSELHKVVFDAADKAQLF